MNRFHWLPGFRRTPIDERRWVVLDVETSGLDPAQDELLCVAALSVHKEDRQWSLVAQDSFEMVIRPEKHPSSVENVLVHGLGWETQEQGAVPAMALEAFRDWVGTSPMLAFHSDFDRIFLQRACRRAGVAMPAAPWLDLAALLPVVFNRASALSLDEWIEVLNVRCERRHQAAADVWATAQLWLKASCAMPGHQHMQWDDWRDLARQIRWIATPRLV